MQSDLETVVIRSDLSLIDQTIKSTEAKLGEAREALLNNNIKESAQDRRKSKGLLSVITSCASLTRQTKNRFQEIISSFGKTNDDRKKRGIEFLGEFLSTITGVPSAQDHRKVIEMLWAIKSRSDGFEKLLKTSAMLNDQILNSLHLHDEKFNLFREQVKAFDQAIGSNTEMIGKTIMSLSILAKLHVSNSAINAILSRAEQILGKGDIERLSRYSISELELGDLIDQIYMRRRTSTPIFDKEDSHFYFSLKLAHTWVDSDKKSLNTILQILIACLAKTQKLVLLESSNILQNDLHMAVVDEGRNEFRYLSSSDYSKCLQTSKGSICQKREISISPRIGCIIKQHNCKNWANKVVHDITNTEILISLPEPQNVTLMCGKSSTRHITLPKTALVHLDLNCNLENPEFSISKLSFRHMDEITVNRGEGIHLEISKEVTALTQGQVSHIISQMEETSIDIGALNQTNQNLLLAIDEHEKEAREKWDEVSSGWSAWEQIAIWASIATEAVIIVAVTTCLCRMYCRVLGKNGAAVVVSTDNELSGLRDRILDLEANILLNKRPKAKALALTREADIESAD